MALPSLASPLSGASQALTRRLAIYRFRFDSAAWVWRTAESPLQGCIGVATVQWGGSCLLGCSILRIRVCAKRAIRMQNCFVWGKTAEMNEVSSVQSGCFVCRSIRNFLLLLSLYHLAREAQGSVRLLTTFPWWWFNGGGTVGSSETRNEASSKGWSLSVTEFHEIWRARQAHSSVSCF
jgi:hypothetical protein